MCDYSLEHLTTIKAEPGMEIALHKFVTGSTGFVRHADLVAYRGSIHHAKSEGGFRVDQGLCPVCVKPGTKLTLGRPCRPVETVTFETDMSTPAYVTHIHRDGVRFADGSFRLLGELPEKTWAVVVDVAVEALAELARKPESFPDDGVEVGGLHEVASEPV